MIRITCKKDEFRRCGVNHTKTPTEYSDERFSPEELERLQVEEMLVVEVLPDTAEKKKVKKDK